MKIAWCPQHRGVMRISFFNPPTKHFGSPCPRCGNKLIEQERGKYEKEVIVDPELFEDEIITKAPRPLCECCEFFKVQPDYLSYCTWCIDCPTEACDIPRSKLRRG